MLLTAFGAKNKYPNVRVAFVSGLYSKLSEIMLADYLSLSLKSGIALEKAFAAASSFVQPASKSKDAKGLSERIASGNSLDAALDSFKALSPSLKWYLSAGYKRGDLPNACAEFAILEEQRLLRRLKLINRILESSLILILGLAVAIMVIGIYSPMSSIGGILGK